MTRVNSAPFNIQAGWGVTRNTQPILFEVRHALEALLASGQTSVIDLRSIPLAPGEEAVILETLGEGEVHARLEALGGSEIYETQYPGVWLVSHYNESGELVSRFIEITKLPEILESQHEDMLNALTALTGKLVTRNM